MRKLLLLALLGYLGYTAYMYITLRQDPAYQTYIAFSGALLSNDELTLKKYAASPTALKPLSAHAARQALIPGKRRFIYHRLLSRTKGADSSEVLRIRQTVRYDPPGANTFYGQESVSDVHTIELKDDHGVWKVVSFEDTPARSLH